MLCAHPEDDMRIRFTWWQKLKSGLAKRRYRRANEELVFRMEEKWRYLMTHVYLPEDMFDPIYFSDHWEPLVRAGRLTQEQVSHGVYRLRARCKNLERPVRLG